MPRPRTALLQAPQAEEAGAAFYQDQFDEFEYRTFPIRGILLATLVSSVLWAALILAVREAWLLLH